MYCNQCWQIAKLSFCPDDDEEEDDEEEEEEIVKEDDHEDRELENEMLESQSDNGKSFKMMKNPDVDTSFLPDRDREDAENRLREELRQVGYTKHTSTLENKGCKRMELIPED